MNITLVERNTFLKNTINNVASVYGLYNDGAIKETKQGELVISVLLENLHLYGKFSLEYLHKNKAELTLSDEKYLKYDLENMYLSNFSIDSASNNVTLYFKLATLDCKSKLENNK